MSPHLQRAQSQRSLVGFSVGEVRYAVPINGVREIVNPLPLIVLPHAPAPIAGVAGHRGDVVAVIDLRRRFGLPPAESGCRSKWVLVSVAGKTVGLVVDEVTEVFGAEQAGTRPAPSLGGGEEQRGIAEVVLRDGTMTFVLALDRFDELATAALKAHTMPPTGE